MDHDDPAQDAPRQGMGQGAARSWPDKVFALTLDEAAERLHVHRNTISDMVNSGAVRARRLGRKWLVPLSALEEFLAGEDNQDPARWLEEELPANDGWTTVEVGSSVFRMKRLAGGDYYGVKADVLRRKHHREPVLYPAFGTLRSGVVSTKFKGADIYSRDDLAACLEAARQAAGGEGE